MGLFKQDKKITLSTIGIEMPRSFPSQLYDSINKTIWDCKNMPQESKLTFAASWNGLAHRFFACFDHDKEFTKWIKKRNRNSSYDVRHQYERALFNFIVNGQSSIESLCFALFSIGAYLSPSDFPMQTIKELRRINPESTAKKYKALFSSEKLSTTLKTFVDYQDWIDWKEIRNILAHRCSPGITIYKGGAEDGKVTGINNIDINDKTTSSKLDWLSNQIELLLTDIDSFTQDKCS